MVARYLHRCSTRIYGRTTTYQTLIMKVIIAGSRGIGPRTAAWLIASLIETHLKDIDITEVVSGTALGVDQGGELYAQRNSIPVLRFPANWDKHGKSAGHIRNAEMAEHADALIAVWDGVSRGTRHMIDLAEKKGLVVKIINTSR